MPSTDQLRFGARVVVGAGRVALSRLRFGPLRPSWTWRTELLRMVMRESLDGAVRRGIPWLRGIQEAGALPSPALALSLIHI